MKQPDDSTPQVGGAPAKALAEALVQALGLQGRPITEIHLHLRSGEPARVTLTQLLTSRELGLLAARLYRQQFRLEPVRADGALASRIKLDGSEQA